MALGTSLKTEEDWGRRVRDRRKAQRMTQAELADRCEVVQSTISRIEKGDVVTRDKLKIRIAMALKSSVESLFPWPNFWG